MNSLTLNTWGLHAINRHTFRVGSCCVEEEIIRETIPNAEFAAQVRAQHQQRVLRDGMEIHRNLSTCLRIYKLILDVLGYIPVISTISGCVRIGFGVLFLSISVPCLNRPGRTLEGGGGYQVEYATKGSKDFLVELRLMAIAQIARGVFEAFVPYGKLVNATLDVIATPINIIKGDFSLAEAKALHIP